MVQSIGGISKYSATDLDRLAQELNQDGICVIRNLFKQKLIDE